MTAEASAVSTAGTTGGTTQIYEISVVEIYEYSDEEVELDLNFQEKKGSTPNFETEEEKAVETTNEEYDK